MSGERHLSILRPNDMTEWEWTRGGGWSKQTNRNRNKEREINDRKSPFSNVTHSTSAATVADTSDDFTLWWMHFPLPVILTLKDLQAESLMHMMAQRDFEQKSLFSHVTTESGTVIIELECLVKDLLWVSRACVVLVQTVKQNQKMKRSLWVNMTVLSLVNTRHPNIQTGTSDLCASSFVANFCITWKQTVGKQ